jgi:hypothetical protein
MLSHETDLKIDAERAFMTIAIETLKGRGLAARFFNAGHSVDAILVTDGGMDYWFTPWFFEVEGHNFAISEWAPGADEPTRWATKHVDFDDMSGLADLIVAWLADKSF